jgi:outer membrane immunogenic protein
MKKFILPLIASLAIATPALANEGRAEVRGGVIWSNGDSEATYGAALGYDWDLGETTFVGAEVSGDKIDAPGTKVAWGLTGRAGIKAGEKTKLFAAGGYTTEPCNLCADSWHAGGGVEQGLGQNFYVKGEYRHNFTSNGLPDSDAVVAGVGLKF